MRRLKDKNCLVVEKKIVPAKDGGKYIKDGKEITYSAQPEKFKVRILGGVEINDTVGYEDSYLITAEVDKTKYDLTKIFSRVDVSYDYGTEKYMDKFSNISYEFINEEKGE